MAEVDIIMGDWLSEMTMTIHGAGKVQNSKSSASSTKMSLEERVKGAMFAENFH
jgi:hypothetical protein